MKNIKVAILIFLVWANDAQACEACDLQQPTITKSFTHGVGPQSNWDWLIVAIIAIITLVTLYYSFRFLIKPGEKNNQHIKKSILNF